MQITYLDLAGHKKIKNGTGKDRIYFLAKPGINLIQGPNGVGKSTILNELTPFPSNSSNWIGNASKSIRFILDNEKYEASYYWENGKPKEAYFFKFENNIEHPIPMTTKNTFAAVIEALTLKLGLDANFEALTCLSSYDNKSFALLRPAERKKFLNTIVQNLDVYNNIYKTLSKRSSIFKAMVGTLTAKISNLGGTPLNFGEHIRSHQGVIDSLVAEKDELTRQILSFEMTPEKIKEQHDAVQSKEVIFKDFTSTHQKIKDEIVRMFQGFQMNVTCTEVPELLASKESDLKELYESRSKFLMQQRENNRALASCRKNIYEYSTILNNALANEDYKTYTTSMSETFKQQLAEAYDYRDSIYKRYDKELITETYNFIELFCDDQTFSRFKSIFIAKLKEGIAITYSFKDLKKYLMTDFKDFCDRYIPDGRHFQVEKILEMKHKLYQLIKDQIPTLDGRDPIEVLDELDRAILHYHDYVKIIEINQELLQYLDSFMIPKTWRKFFDQIIEFQDVHLGDIDEIYDNITEYKFAQETIALYEQSRDTIEKGEAISKNIAELREFIDQNEKHVKKLESESSVIEANLTELDLDINTCEKIIIALKKLDEYIKRVNDLQYRLELLDQIIKPIPDLTSLETRIHEINSQLKEENDIIYKLRYSSDIFDEYAHELTQVENNYSRLETLKKYCSPSSGIQIIFIDLYINKILEMANKLLGMFFNGEFVIQPFKITDKDFQIPVKGNGLLIDDISSLSASQMTIVNMCISFAIMMHSSSKLNIIRLDEMDAPLDDVNSYIFPELVNTAMEFLNCEQAWIITHSVMSQNSSNYNIIRVNEL